MFAEVELYVWRQAIPGVKAGIPGNEQILGIDERTKLMHCIFG